MSSRHLEFIELIPRNDGSIRDNSTWFKWVLSHEINPKLVPNNNVFGLDLPNAILMHDSCPCWVIFYI